MKGVLGSAMGAQGVLTENGCWGCGTRVKGVLGSAVGTQGVLTENGY